MALSQGPCRLTGQINGELVYDKLGAMSNVVGSWISTAKGTRRLQYKELAKANGINELLSNCEDTKLRTTIRESAGIHLWVATLDALGQCLRGPIENDDQTAPTLEDADFPPWEEASDDELDDGWS
jgi:hypothetical protein